MTAVEVYEWTTRGGTTDFAPLIEACESFGAYCLIGGLAINCYVEPVYMLDADIVATSQNLAELIEHLTVQGVGSDLRIQFHLG